ncbi:histidine kinase [Christiangramia aquimixticola]|uniref:sensor histidine kinase n=1 Tax=Christiangramia aquimixticola TaxID=1697558 RepID=UPI003AA866FE
MPSFRINKLFLLLIIWVNIGLAQNFPGRNYTSSSELPNNTVRSLLVDSQNSLWIGTENGVVKKENDVFKYFFEEVGLAQNSTWAIEEDTNANLWFGSYGEGLSIFDGSNFKVVSKQDGLIHNEITRLFPYQEKMFVGTSNGVSVVDINTFEATSFSIPDTENLFRVQDFFLYQDNVYVATYNSGVFKISDSNDPSSLIKVNKQTNIYSVIVEKDSIYSCNKGFITKGKLEDFVSQKPPPHKLGHSIVWDHVTTIDQKKYVAAWGIFEPSGGIFELNNDRLISKASEFNISSKEVISLAYDENFERLYVGTKDAGLYEVSLNPQIKFEQLQRKSVTGFAKTKNASAILLNDGVIIKGKTEATIDLIQLKSWQEEYVLSTHLPLPKHEDSYYELDYNTGAGDIKFYDIKSSEGIFWINTNIGIYAIQPSGKLERYLPIHSEEINFTNSGKLIETNPYGGVRIYDDLDNFSFTHYKQEASHTPTMVVNSLRTDDKTYLLSVFSGLYSWDGEKFTSYLHKDIWKEKKLRHITTLGNQLAISNEFGDVFVIEDKPVFKILQKIPRAQIKGNTIAFLKEYKGSLIIGTERGLNHFTENRLVFLDEEQGLKQPLFTAEIFHDTLRVGSENGFYNIDLKAVSELEPKINSLKLEETLINNQPIPHEEFSDKAVLHLAHNENTVLLKFSTNAHPFPKKLDYQYRLNKIEEWSLPSPNSEIFLPFLSAGDYEVAVKVTDNSTGLVHNQKLIKLTVSPPYWKTWWFISLIFLIILLLIFGIYRFQIGQTRKFEAQKSLIQKRFEETKMEALLAQMNPHFIFNAMNSIQNYILDSDIEKATIFLGDFAKLIRLNLDHCTKPHILLVEEIEYLESYIRVENTRFGNKIEVKIETDPAIDLYEVEIPTMLLQTFVENVFVHAFPATIKDPTLVISFELIEDQLMQCIIKDNGIGFSSQSNNKLHESKGVNLVEERLALLGYADAIQINSGINKGTTVIITLEI